MDDNKIIELYWKRNESALYESNLKYGRLCRSIAYNILYSKEDSEECVNDTWFKAWDSIPPKFPRKLGAFLSVITRNLALDRYNYNKAQKRNDKLQAVMDEFWECFPQDKATVEDEVVLKELINGFLRSLDVQTRIIFMRRYWYACSVKEIASALKLTESNVNVILHRTRNSFRQYLEKEGINL